jgi:serine protease Do
MKRTLVVGLTLPLLVVSACAPGDDATPDRLAAGSAAPEEGFRAVVEAVLPAIVFIQAETPAPAELEALLPRGHPMQDQPFRVGIGSGVIYTDDGYILTNNHVVQDAERVLVVLHDRRFLEATVVGRDPSTEVAVVKIEGSGFPTATIGDSDAIGLGDWALAMGSPMGLQFSVTAGIISGIGRNIGILQAQARIEGASTAPLEHFIQTDAALSPGNSGGPLLNTAGEVVGINTAVTAAQGGAAGFAIPSNLARRVADQLVEHGEARRAYLGVELRNMTPELARSEGLERVAGAIVVRLEDGGPAHQAGAQPGDVIMAIDDVPVLTVSGLQVRLAQLDPGTTVELRVLRDRREQDLNVELGVMRQAALPESQPAPAIPR